MPGGDGIEVLRTESVTGRGAGYSAGNPMLAHMDPVPERGFGLALQIHRVRSWSGPISTKPICAGLT